MRFYILTSQYSESHAEKSRERKKKKKKRERRETRGEREKEEEDNIHTSVKERDKGVGIPCIQGQRTVLLGAKGGRGGPRLRQHWQAGQGHSHASHSEGERG